MKKAFYLFNPGRLSRKDNTLKFTPMDEEGNEQAPRYLPVENIDQFYIFGSLETNSSLYNFLGKNQIAAHFFDYYENYTGSFMPHEHLLSGKLLVAQVGHYSDKNKRMAIAQKFVQGAAFNMTKNLRYYNSRGKDLQPFIDTIEKHAEHIGSTRNIPELMGIEGNIRIKYYESFNLMINEYPMDGRTKQPPTDIVNALISFGNMLCYTECLRAIHQTQLNPVIAYLHEPGERRYSLALDIAEIFKPIIVDRIIFKVLNKKEIQVRDFEESVNRVILKPEGKKKFLHVWDSRLNETIHHRKLNRSVSYKQLIRLECYKLIKHIMNMEEYHPLKMWW
jgi:CRISP-associated protein Cas1